MKCGVSQLDSAAFFEVQASLNSIMPFSTLASFLSLSAEDKLQHLEVPGSIARVCPYVIPDVESFFLMHL